MIEAQLARNWEHIVDNPAARFRIASDAIRHLNQRGPSHAVREPHPPQPGRYGFEGVDKIRSTSRTYRARISIWDCGSGKWVRISKTGFATPEEAGFWYACMHIAFWGSLSRYANEIDITEYESRV